MKKLILNLIVLTFFCSLNSVNLTNAQTATAISDEEKAIIMEYPMALYFVPNGINSDDKARQVEEAMMDDPNIYDCRINIDGKSVIYAKEEVDRAYVIPLLEKEGVLVNLGIFIENRSLKYRTGYYKPASYPIFVKSGNDVEDERRYSEQLDTWKKEHRDEWKYMNEHRSDKK